MSAGHVGGTRRSGNVSSMAAVLGVSVVRGMRGALSGTYSPSSRVNSTHIVSSYIAVYRVLLVSFSRSVFEAPFSLPVTSDNCNNNNVHEIFTLKHVLTRIILI